MTMKKKGRAVRMRSILVLQLLFCLFSKARTTSKEGVGYHGDAESHQFYSRNAIKMNKTFLGLNSRNGIQ